MTSDTNNGHFVLLHLLVGGIYFAASEHFVLKVEVL